MLCPGLLERLQRWLTCRLYDMQIDKCFGFDTAVEQAQEALLAAKVEAGSAYHGIGVVKLMGRSSGFIAMQASLASGAPTCRVQLAGHLAVGRHRVRLWSHWYDSCVVWQTAMSCISAGVVDVCLIPEVKFDLQGDRGLLKFVQGLLDEKGHCVVCIAEGAGQVCLYGGPPCPVSGRTVVPRQQHECGAPAA